MKTKIVYLITLVALLAGCATQESTLRSGDKYKLYEISEKAIFQMVYEEMHKETKNEVIRAIDGPERGYTVRFYPGLGLDYYDVSIRVVPVTGRDEKGVERLGYYAQLLGNGTYPSSKPNKILLRIERRLDAEGNPVTVRDIRTSNYVWDRDRWRLNDRPSARESNDTKSASDRLRELKVLLEEDSISPEEYEEKRVKILNEL